MPLCFAFHLTGEAILGDSSPLQVALNLELQVRIRTPEDVENLDG